MIVILELSLCHKSKIADTELHAWAVFPRTVLKSFGRSMFCPICAFSPYAHLAHTRMGYPIHVWDDVLTEAESFYKQICNTTKAP